LDRDLDRRASLVTRIEAGLEELKEYRTALITNAVTGKIDVRHYSPKTIL